ncbi:UDP-GlcNAc:undecaprenyl-phosphate GlcNAc-1-phosphate transferase [Mariprofundus ferrinatatus]|uniref:UDP-GlcNAc:undecaprenyl-phosphate GlcNAc-1-phosphate transferase n=1 Tax=Mariprofundus ferrinatatus TaxID=1921087 RepID=A0A2K8L4E9_9PROT|nr:MraY family glycosyltransferase [Mariprofundus ferrinatatus]ATX81982.1 UDP-GlcNAc:undecaprenyl-phosphate GlcNAc-1-phosphate transferase [Mariprofundus ferrinatatus]
MSLEDLGLLFFTVLILSLLLTPLSAHFAAFVGAVDHPVERSVHKTVMPRMGGLGMALSLLVILPLLVDIDRILLGFLAGLLIATLTGVADDIWAISPKLKFAGQVIASVVFIELSGVQMDSFGDLFSFGDITFPGLWAFLITLVCLLGVTNSMNLSDGLDGLSGGITAISCFFLGAFALGINNGNAFLLLTAILAAVLGFLKFNTHPAKLFMGDTGSLMLGFALASVGVMLGSSGKMAPISVAIILGIPVVDTILVMSRRIVKRKSPFHPDKTHIHHRLLALGFSHATVVSMIYVGMISFGLLALVVKDLPEYWQLANGVALMAVFYGVLFLCEHHQISFKTIVKANKETEVLRHDLVVMLGKTTSFFPYVILAGLSVPLLFSTAIEAEMATVGFAVVVFVALAFPWKNEAKQLAVVCGLFYLSAYVILFAWGVSSYEQFDLTLYAVIFMVFISIWAALKIKFKQRKTKFLTSSFEILLIFTSWFIPFVVLPAIEVPEKFSVATKLACLGAVPLFIAIKLVVRRKSADGWPTDDRRKATKNWPMATGMIMILCIIILKSI